MRVASFRRSQTTITSETVVQIVFKLINSHFKTCHRYRSSCNPGCREKDNDFEKARRKAGSVHLQNSRVSASLVGRGGFQRARKRDWWSSDQLEASKARTFVGACRCMRTGGTNRLLDNETYARTLYIYWTVNLGAIRIRSKESSNYSCNFKATNLCGKISRLADTTTKVTTVFEVVCRLIFAAAAVFQLSFPSFFPHFSCDPMTEQCCCQEKMITFNLNKYYSGAAILNHTSFYFPPNGNSRHELFPTAM